VTVRGDLQLTSSSVNSQVSSSTVQVLNGLTLRTEDGLGNGTANLANSGRLAFRGTQTFDNGTINLASSADVTVERPTGGAATTLTLGPNATIQGSGGIGQTCFLDCAATSLINQGTISANLNAQTLTVGLNSTQEVNNFTNQGTVESRNGGVLNLNAQTITNFSGTTLTGGTWGAFGNGSTTTLLSANAIVTNAAELIVSGTGSVLRTRHPNTSVLTNLESSLVTNNGALRVLGNRSFANTNALANNGTFELGGGTFTAPGLTNANGATIKGFGTITPRPTNSGTIIAQGGTLVMGNGIQGGSGTVQIDPGASLDLSGGASGSNADFLIHNGTNLNLGANNFTVAVDYQNGNSGVGNSFNRRANVTGAGQILAAGAVTNRQTLSGDIVGGGTTTGNATIAFNNVHVGDVVTKNYQIGNVADAGPMLRGAIQTTVNGGNITDARLSGTGVTASNYGPLAAGANTGNLAVTLSVTAAGALTGQAVHILNNFDNTNSQTINVTGAGYRLAQANTVAPINFGAVHVNDSVSQALSISNLAVNDAFSEKLNAGFGGTSDARITTNGGSISLLNPGTTNNSNMVVGLNTSAAGLVNGTVTVNFKSDGTGTSGLGLTNLPSQNVNVSGDIQTIVQVFRLAEAGPHSPEPVVLANQRVGGSLTQLLSMTNTAINDGFSEKLNASIAPTTGAASAGGAFNLLGAQQTNNTNLLVGVNTATAGAKVGTATITLQSDGTGTSGLGLTNLPSQIVNVSGNVYRMATASAHTPEPVNFGDRHVGAVVSQALSLTNTAANDSFSEKLNASLGGATGHATGSGSFNLLNAGSTNNANLLVGMDTSTVGVKSGTATITLASDGTGTSGFVATGIGTQTVNVQGTVYRLASASDHSPEPVNLGNARVGQVKTQQLGLTNTAANDGFSERLNATIGGATAGVTATGTINQLTAGATSNNLIVGLDTATVGNKSGTATITLQSDGTGINTLGTTALGTQTVNVNGAVYRTAAASQPGVVNFGNVHVGDVVAAQALSIQNTAAADGFSEKLNVIVSSTPTGVTSSGSVALLNAQATSTNINVGLNTATAGGRNGTVVLNLVSDGAGTSELGQLSIGTRNVQVQGNVFRLAQANTINSVNFGVVHVGDVVAELGLTIQNVAVNDGFSEKLNAGFGATSDARITKNGGSISLLTAGATNSTNMKVGLNTASSGVVNGTVTVNLQSDGTGTSGLGTTNLASQNVAVSGTISAIVANLADPVINNAQPINLGKFREGQLAQTNLSITNNAPVSPVSETLRASVAGTTGHATASGLIGPPSAVPVLAPGATDTTSMVVGINTATAGAKIGTATLAFVSDGTAIPGGFLSNLANQTVNVQAEVYRTAVGSTSPSPINFGNQRLNQVAAQMLTVLNTASADGFSEGLDAAFSGATGAASHNNGTVGLLAAGGSNNTTMQVALNTTTAGAKTGSVTLAYQSNGQGTSGFGAIAAGGQTINVSGNVFREAVGNVTPPSANFAARVGDVVAAQAVTVANIALADGFSETLHANVGTAPTGFTTAGSSAITNLAAGSSNSSSLKVALQTGTAGTFNGLLDVNLASHLDGHSDLPLTTQQVALSGKVYTPAVPQVTQTELDFGIVHVGEVTSAKTLVVKNNALVTALNDTLRGTFHSATGPFTASGNLGAGLGAQVTDTTSLAAHLSTANAGIFNGSGLLSLVSSNPDMADLAFADQNIVLKGQVNNFAQGEFAFKGGQGSFSKQSPTSFLLDFGSIVEGSAARLASLALGNAVLGPADLLDGLFQSVGSALFGETGFSSLQGLEAGEQKLGLGLAFNPLTVGQFTKTITFKGTGHNASGFSGNLADVILLVKGTVTAQPTGQVPEPGTLLLLASGLAGLAAWRRKSS
jgi:hypothetical protein